MLSCGALEMGDGIDGSREESQSLYPRGTFSEKKGDEGMRQAGTIVGTFYSRASSLFIEPSRGPDTDQTDPMMPPDSSSRDTNTCITHIHTQHNMIRARID